MEVVMVEALELELLLEMVGGGKSIGIAVENGVFFAVASYDETF